MTRRRFRCDRAVCSYLRSPTRKPGGSSSDQTREGAFESTRRATATCGIRRLSTVCDEADSRCRGLTLIKTSSLDCCAPGIARLTLATNGASYGSVSGQCTHLSQTRDSNQAARSPSFRAVLRAAKVAGYPVIDRVVLRMAVKGGSRRLATYPNTNQSSECRGRGPVRFLIGRWARVVRVRSNCVRRLDACAEALAALEGGRSWLP
jgi:hypothetical protein